MALAFPLRCVNGRFRTVPQDSPEHVAQCAEIILRTPQGTFDHDPSLGLRDVLHDFGPVAPAILDALDRHEPRRRFLADEQISDVDERMRVVAVSLQEGR
jgi:phage baseplate assembly protein W